MLWRVTWRPLPEYPIFKLILPTWSIAESAHILWGASENLLTIAKRYAWMLLGMEVTISQLPSLHIGQNPFNMKAHVLEFTFHTCFTVISRKSRFTITAITSLKIDTRSSVLAWFIFTFIYICTKKRKKKKTLWKWQKIMTLVVRAKIYTAKKKMP